MTTGSLGAAVLTLAVVVSVPVAVAATNEPGLQRETAATVAAQSPATVEASLGLDRPARRLIQQRLLNAGFDPGTPDGLFGPRTRAAIREWQQSRGASPTGYLNSADLELLRAAPAPLPAVPQGWVVSGNRPASAPTETDSIPAQPTVANEELNPQNAAETNTQQRTRAADAAHIAIAATNGVDYLVTWNFRHIANATMRSRIEDVCRQSGHKPPVICTPNELLESDHAEDTEGPDHR